MRQRFHFQILLLLAPILASSAFTISSGRTRASAWAGRNNQQLQQRSATAEWLSIHAPESSPSVNLRPFDSHRSYSSPSSFLPATTSGDESSSFENENDDKAGDVESGDTSVVPTWKRVLYFYKYNKDGSIKSNDDDDGLTFKQKLGKMGLSALLSYGFVSNMSYCVTVSLAWFGFSKKTGLSPLAPGQWKGFLAVYAGFYVFNNFIRPMRLAVSVGVTPYFDKAVDAVQRKTKLNKSMSIGIVVFLANICGTTSLMALGIYIASLAAGIPMFPPKA